jgi:hypothetical protein
VPAGVDVRAVVVVAAVVVVDDCGCDVDGLLGIWNKCTFLSTGFIILMFLDILHHKVCDKMQYLSESRAAC